jgi:hypothetical protein
MITGTVRVGSGYDSEMIAVQNVLPRRTPSATRYRAAIADSAYLGYFGVPDATVRRCPQWMLDY